MADEKGTWKRFQRLAFDSKSLSKRAKRAETKTTRHAHKFVVSKLNSLRSARKHIITWLAIVGVIMIAVIAQTMWYQQSYRTAAWSAGGTYAEGVLGPIDTLNPLFASSDAELSTNKLIFSSIYDYDSTNHLRDDLATSTTVSKDERTYTIKLREDAKWSDGTKLTARDIEYTVALMKSPDVRSVMIGNWTDISAKALDDATVVFSLPQRYAAFRHALTFSVLPKHILEDVPLANLRQNTFGVSPIGSGPFTLRLLQPSPDGRHKIANFVANENYYRGKPLLSRFAIHSYQTQKDITTAIATGEVNAGSDVDSASRSIPKSFTKQYVPLYSGVYALFNTNNGILKDTNVRHALQVGTDTQKLRDSLGYPVPKLDLPFVQGQLSGPNIPVAPAYNKALAMKLLDKSGWKKSASGMRMKKQQPLQLTIVTVKNTDYEKVVNELTNQWRELGVAVTVNAQDADNPTQDFVQNVLQPRTYDILVYKLLIGADPDVYAYWHSSQASRLGYNFSNYKSDISDDALTSARSKNIAKLRNEKYKDFAKQWLQDAPALGLYQPVMQYVYSPSVHPVIPTAGITSENDRYGNILYWSAVQDQVYKTP